MNSQTFTLVPQGRFSLRESAMFGFGQRVAFGQREVSADFDGVLRMAFCVDGYRGQVGVEVRQDPEVVRVVLYGDAEGDAVRRQVARVLSLDHDGRGFDALAERDPVIARLQEVAPGLRPPLFYSPYEAAAWAVLSARRPAHQMAQLRTRLSEHCGARFSLAGESVAAFPTPRQLLAVEAFPGLPPEKMARLHGVAQAALDGVLDVATLRAAGPEQAAVLVQQIKGIGPFYASLITIRATGWADVLPVEEPISRALIRELYGFDHEPSNDELATVAEAWRPFRTWATVLIRSAAGRLAGAVPSGQR